MLGNSQNISDAVFDTGCSHSLISANSLNIGNKSLVDLEHEALTDVDVALTMGVGVESSAKQTKNIRKYIKGINNLKEQLKKTGNSKEVCRSELEKKIPPKIESILNKSKNVRYEYIAYGYSIDGVTIGDISIRVSFSTDQKNLIGMHIIKKLYTKIFSINDDTFMVSALDNISVENVEKNIIGNYNTNAITANCIANKISNPN